MKTQYTHKKYLPRAVLANALYFLHRNFTFLRILSYKVNGKIIDCFQFSNHFNETINYFPAVRDDNDAHGADLAYPTIDEWFQAYSHFASKGHGIDVRDLTIVQMLQIRCDRKHFNTLLLQSDDVINPKKGQLQFFLIEPRSNNLFKHGFYPISALLTKMKDFCNQLIGNNRRKHNIKQLKIGTQPFYDDTTCGAHHLNFLEVITKIPHQLRRKPNTLKKLLQQTDLVRRKKDTKNIRTIFANAKLAASGESNIPKDTELADWEFSDDSTANDETYDELFHPHFNKKLSEIIKKESELQRLKAIDHAIREINVYNDCYQKQTFKFFGGHTRQLTAQSVCSMLSEIKKGSDHVLLIKAAILLFCTRDSIHTLFHSAFYQVLNNALAHILDCEPEYQKAEKQFFGSKHAIDRLFKQRLAWLLVGAKLNYFVIKNVLETMQEINDADASMHYKFGNKKERLEMDEERKDNMKLINELLSQAFAPSKASNDKLRQKGEANLSTPQLINRIGHIINA